MPSIITPDVTGDLKISWDPEKPAEVEHARQHFNTLKKQGHIFFKVAARGKKGEKVSSFEESAAKLICEFDPKSDVVATRVPVGG